MTVPSRLAVIEQFQPIGCIEPEAAGMFRRDTPFERARNLSCLAFKRPAGPPLRLGHKDEVS